MTIRCPVMAPPLQLPSGGRQPALENTQAMREKTSISESCQHTAGERPPLSFGGVAIFLSERGASAPVSYSPLVLCPRDDAPAFLSCYSAPEGRGTKRTQTGLPTVTDSPVGCSLPVIGSMRNTTTLSPS